MSGNFPCPSLLGTPDSRQLSLPVVSNAAPFTGSVSNSCRVSVPAVSSAWLLPSDTVSSFQPLLGRAYLYQPSDTSLQSAVWGQNQIPIVSSSYPGIIEWNLTGSSQKKSSSLGDSTVTIIDQDTAMSSMPMTIQYDKPLDTNTIGSLYPSLPISLIQGPPNQGHSFSVPHQEGSQVYYNQGTVGPLLPGDLGPCLQSYGTELYTGVRAPALQPEMVLVLKEIQPVNALLPSSTSGTYYSISDQPISEARFPVMERSLGMETSLTWQPPSQIFCLPQTPECPKSCTTNIQLLESLPPNELRDIALMAAGETSSNLLALPPAPSQEQTEDKNPDEGQIKLFKHLDACLIPTENNEPPLMPLEIPDIHQLLACVDPLNQEKQPGARNPEVRKTSFSAEDQGALDNEFEASTRLEQDIYVPQGFISLEDLDQAKGLEPIGTKGINVNVGQEKASMIKTSFDQVGKKKHKASESLTGAPEAKIQVRIPEREVPVFIAETSDRAPVKRTNHSTRKAPKSAPDMIKKKKTQAEKAQRRRENNPKKAGDSKQPGNQVLGLQPGIPKRKRKNNQPELGLETFQKPRSSLGTHMLESVQVFHALGKRSDNKGGLHSSRALGNTSNTKDPRPAPATKPWLHIPPEGKGPEQTQVRAQKPDDQAENLPSAPQDEGPPPGKVKLLPLPFLPLDKPQVRPVPRRPQALASHHPSRPGSINSAQTITGRLSQPAPVNASAVGPAGPTRPIFPNPTRPAVTNPARPRVLQSAPPKPAAYTAASGTALQGEPVTTVGSKLQAPPKPQSQFLLEDFSLQPIPWRKPNVPEPVMSMPITKEQRPEREAMKRRAQQEREEAAKYTALGKVRFFAQREKDMEISRFYGYAL